MPNTPATNLSVKPNTLKIGMFQKQSHFTFYYCVST